MILPCLGVRPHVARSKRRIHHIVLSLSEHPSGHGLGMLVGSTSLFWRGNRETSPHGPVAILHQHISGGGSGRTLLLACLASEVVAIPWPAAKVVLLPVQGLSPSVTRCGPLVDSTSFFFSSFFFPSLPFARSVGLVLRSERLALLC